MEKANGWRVLPSGNVALFEDGRLVSVTVEDDQPDEAPPCPSCDAYHSFFTGCWFENTADYSGEPEWAL